MKHSLKTSLILMLLTVLSAASAVAQNSFHLKHNTNLEPGTVGTLEFELDNIDNIYGFQCTVKLPTGLKLDNSSMDSITLDRHRADVNYRIETNNNSDGDVLKIAVFSYANPQMPFSWKSGTLLKIKVKVDSETFKGGVLTVTDIKLVGKNDKDINTAENLSYVGVLPTGVKLVVIEDGEEKSIPKDKDGDLAISLLDYLIAGSSTEHSTARLKAIIEPDYATVRDLSWVSSKDSIASIGSIEEDGEIVNNEVIVTAEKRGRSAISVTTANGKSAFCDIVIYNQAATGIAVDPTEIHLKIGESATIEANPKPEDATDKISWSSSDENCVVVNKVGEITAIAMPDQNPVLITASSSGKNGTFSASCDVYVDPIPAERIELSDHSASIKVESEFTLYATVYPENTTYPTVTWTSSDESVATVDQEGKIDALSLGTTTITATCGNVSDVCILTVVAIPVEMITIPETLTIGVGQSLDIIPTIWPENATDKTLIWSSSDKSIVSVDFDGTITGVTPGEAIITATSGSVTATCTVTVLQIPVSSITLNQNSAQLKISDSLTLIPTIFPANASDQTVTWESSDPSIVTVNANGTITGVALGEALITVRCGQRSAICTVTVVPNDIIEVISIRLSNTELLMRAGYTAELFAIIDPSNATDQSVTWISSDETIATVDQNGIVTAITPGNCTITATASNGTKADCHVTVVLEIIAVTDISLNKKAIELHEGEEFNLIATITPDDATDKTVTWKSSDRAVATCSQEGVVSAISVGNAIIYASSSNGLTVECAVTVLPAIVPVTSVSLSNYTLLMREGYSAELLAIVHPDNATDKRVTWSSDNEAVATVDDNGKVTANTSIVNANKVGTATITATSVFDPTKKADCVVTVDTEENIKAVTDITLNKWEIEIYKGETFNLIATITPADATDPSVEWRTSDRAVATVSQTGIVTGIEEGTAIIYASSSNGLTVECKVTVLDSDIDVESISLTNTDLLMRKGYTAELYAVVRPDNATDKRVTWTSTDESIITVDQNGIVTAVEVGLADVIVTSVYDPTITKECHVTVVNEGDIIPVEEIQLNKYEIDIFTGDTYPLIATILPENATDKTVTWKSADRAIATCSEEGIVTAIGVGTTVIYASTSNGLTVECKVNVTDYVPVVSISLTNTELLMREGYTAELYAIVRPDNASDKNVVWSSTDEAIATVDQNGLVTAIKQGNTIVSATSANGVHADCYVTVVPEVIAVQEITLSEYELTMIEGDTHQLYATITPEEVTDPTITWRSTDRNVASVSNDGLVTANNNGVASILASSSNGLTAECIVTVYHGNRPLTPRQLLRKGDGTSCTFVTLIDYSDSELSSQGIRFAYGYDTADGASVMIENTPLRYCHTTSDIFNDSSLDFWVFSYYLNGEGEVVNSNLRYLDGREEMCYDASNYFGNTRTEEGDDEDWIRVTPYALYITPSLTADSRVEIFTIEELRSSQIRMEASLWIPMILKLSSSSSLRVLILW